MTETPEPEPVAAAIEVLAQALATRPLHAPFPKPSVHSASRWRRIAAGQDPDDESPTTNPKGKP